MAVLVHLSAPQAADAAAGQWSSLAETIFRNYGREQRLPPQSPTALAQDGDGFLWIGTQDGLVRWDGYQFRQYDSARPDGRGLPRGWIDTLHADASGRLWVGMDSAGLVRYDRDNDRFEVVPVGPSAGDKHIGAIGDDGAGGLWVGTGGGLYHLAPGLTPGAEPVITRNDSRGLLGEKILAVLTDHQGGLWVGTDMGLFRRAAGAFERVTVPAPPGAPVLVSALFEDREGRMWIGTTQQGLYVVDPGKEGARPFEGRDPAGWSLAMEHVVAIASAGEHELWVAMRGAGVADIDLATGRVLRIRHDKFLADSLPHDDIWTMLRDRAGSLWLGGIGGLSQYARNAGIVTTVFGDTMRPEGISARDVTSVMSARDGRVWLGFLTGGVDIFDPLAGRVAQLRPDPTRRDRALPRDGVGDLEEAADGAVYIGTARGVYRADRNGRHVTLLRPRGRDPHAYARHLLLDGDTLWIGGPGGLWRAPLGTGSPSPARRLNKKDVFAILRGRDRTLWVGTTSGLDRLDIAAGAVESLAPDPDDPSSLPAHLVTSLLQDRQGRLWAATYGGGVAVMTGRDGGGRPRFHRIGVTEGLPNVNVDKLLLDGAGFVWASTEDGLAVIDPANFKARAIPRSDSGALAAYWVTSGATDVWGEPLFGGEGGLAVVRPGWPRAASQPSPIVVSDIRIAGKPVPSGRFNGAGSSRPLVLSPETPGLAVEFASLDDAAPEARRYAYRLQGFDRGWIETDASRRIAAYTNLPPGDYRLEVRGAAGDAPWGPVELRIPIRVLPAWYQTLWARLAFLVAGAAAAAAFVWMVVRVRTGYLQRRQSELESLVAAQTADLLAANARLSELATTDPLTGCANRRHFIERARELSESGRTPGSDRAAVVAPISLAILDFDNFKDINDTYGHPVGDEVLRIAGQVGRARIRETDLIGRIGGEEFALLMPETDAADAQALADRLRRALAGVEVKARGATVRPTASVGLAQQRQGEDFDSLYARADTALYAAKAAGRDRVVVAP